MQYIDDLLLNVYISFSRGETYEIKGPQFSYIKRLFKGRDHVFDLISTRVKKEEVCKAM